MENYIYKPATELARLIREGKATSKEIVGQHIERIKKLDGELHAMVLLFEEEAMKLADERDRETSQGKIMGPLHGVPVTLKECFWMKGVPSTVNFKFFKDFIAPRDAVLVSRIRESGAIIIGKTNVPRSLMDFQVSGDLYPEGKNPYNTDYTPGGSTGGGAAALAAGFSPLETGSDIGGSVRLPAAFCGLFGLKPTDRTVPLDGNMPIPRQAKSFLVHMAQAGPLARDIEGLELLWRLIVGPHESDRNIPRIEWKAPTERPLSEYRIAWVDGWPGFPTSKTVGEAIHSLVTAFTAKGGKAGEGIPDKGLHMDSLRLDASLLPYVIAQGVPWFIRWFMRWQMKATFFKGEHRFNKEINKAFQMDANHYGEVMLMKNRITERWEKIFREVDFLVCPVAYGPAIKRCKTGSNIRYEGKTVIYPHYMWPFTACFNASGHPAITIPFGMSPENLPIGIQIVGPYWSEPELIRFAGMMASLGPGFTPPILK